jgi:hypothetical protein
MDKEGMLLYVFYVFDVIKTHDASLPGANAGNYTHI